MYKMCGNNVKLKFLFLWHLIAIICFLSINTSSSTYLKLNNNNHRIIDDSNANNDSSNDDDGSNNKEDNFVSGTEVERRMFSGLVYNKPTTTKTENADSNNNLRFQSLSVQQTSKERLAAIEKMKVGICACKFEDTISATKVTGEAGAGDCAPKTALCGFCMNAAYASYWNPAQDTCAQYFGPAKQVCEAVAGGASKAGEALEHLYKTYGPEFGATAVWCRHNGCCAAE